MDDSWSQLKAYTEHGDEAAFTKLVEAHLGLVYSAAFRTLDDATAAEEVTQRVFILLAEKAPSLRPNGALSVWLYRVACLTAKKLRHEETTRRQRESDTQEMNESLAPDEEELDWDRVAPLLDEALASLRDADRTAIILRFFQKRPLREVGVALGVSEDAARKRVVRSIEKLRDWFTHRGVACSAGALGATVGAHGVQAVPQSLTVASIQSSVMEAGVSTSTTTSMFTIMASTKGFFTGAVLLGAMVPISMSILKRPTPGPLATTSPAKLEALAIPDAAASGLIAEWEALMANHGPANGTLADVYEVIKGIDDNFRRRAFRGALITEWIARDPSGALAYFQAHDSARVTHCLREWLRADPPKACEAMLADSSKLEGSIGSLIREVAELAPEAVPELAQFVKKTDSWSSPVKDAFAKLSESDPAQTRTDAEAMTGPQQMEALAGLAMGWGKVNGPEALAWAQSLDDSMEGKGEIMRELLVGWAKSDPTAALDRISLAPPGRFNPMNIASSPDRQILRTAAEADFEATLTWIGENPGKLGPALGGLQEEFGRRLKADSKATLDQIRDHVAAEDLMPALTSQLLGEGYAQRDAVWEWLGQQKDSPIIRDIRLHLMRSAGQTDPQLALTWLKERPDSLAPKEREQLFLSIISGADQWPVFEHLLDSAPTELRTTLLEKSYQYLYNQEFSQNPDAWIERIDSLPPDKRPQASGSVASAMAFIDPVEAIDWADSLANPLQANQAISAAVRVWANVDSYECSEWIATLAPGGRRDHAALALIEGIAHAEPHSAWEWAKTIEEPQLRSEALSLAFGSLNAQDPQASSAWLQDDALTETDRHQLMQEGTQAP